MMSKSKLPSNVERAAQSMREVTSPLSPAQQRAIQEAFDRAPLKARELRDALGGFEHTIKRTADAVSQAVAAIQPPKVELDALRNALGGFNQDTLKKAADALSLAAAAQPPKVELDALRNALGTLDQDALKKTSETLRQAAEAAARLPEPNENPIRKSSADRAQGANAAASRALRKVALPADLGQLVRVARKKMKLSQQRFADLAGVGRRFISELETGKATLELGKVLAVCRAAGIDIFAGLR